MKKIFLILSAFSLLALSFVTSGCSGGSGDETTPSTAGYNKTTADPTKPASPKNAGDQKPVTAQ